MAARFVVDIKSYIFNNYWNKWDTYLSDMLHYVKRSIKVRYCTSGKRYSVETHAYNFKTVVKYKKMIKDIGI